MTSLLKDLEELHNTSTTISKTVKSTADHNPSSCLTCIDFRMQIIKNVYNSTFMSELEDIALTQKVPIRERGFSVML